MKQLLTLSLIILVAITSFSSCQTVMGTGAAATVKWTTIEKVLNRKKMKKKVFIEVYTNWCSWCKRMDKTTFSDPKIAKYVNTYFYPVKFNAEGKDEIVFQGKTYRYADTGRRGRHELATLFMQDNEKVGYPTLVFLDEELNLIQAVPGFRSTEEFEVIVTYFGEGHYKNTPWSEYEANYEPMSMK